MLYSSPGAVGQPKIHVLWHYDHDGLEGGFHERGSIYPGVRILDRPAVWQHAADFGLFHDAEDTEKQITNLLQVYEQVVARDGSVSDPDRLARADRLYANLVNTTSGFDTGRVSLLQVHDTSVCELSRTNRVNGPAQPTDSDDSG